MSVYWDRLQNPESAGPVMEPFRQVDIPFRLDDWAYTERRELSERSDDLVARLDVSHGFLEVEPLEAYLDEQLRAVVPNPMIPGRPGAFEIRTLKSIEANAYALTTGTIILTSGLLASIESEDELRAVIAHEVAHIYLDHHVTAYRAAERRQTWAAVIGTVAGAALSEIAWQASGRMGASIATQFWLSVGADVAARVITAAVIESIGLRFSREQEKEADLLAQLWLMEHKAHPAALVSVFERARLDTLSGRSHPSANERHGYVHALAEDIYGTSVPRSSLQADSAYLALTVAATVQQAEMSISTGRIEDALKFADRARRVANPGSDLAAMAAYVAAKASRESGKSPDAVLSLLDEADAGDAVPSAYVHIERGLVYADAGQDEQAKTAFLAASEQMQSGSSYPRALIDWVDQVIIMLGPERP